MSQSVQMRATSIGVSFVLLGAAAFLAISMRFVVPMDRATETNIIDAIFNPPSAPATPLRERTPAPTLDNAILVTPDFPREPLTEIVAETNSRPTPTDDLVVLTDPAWVRRPSDLARYYPRRALRRQLEGAVILNCLVDVGGGLSCHVVSETPAGWGFAEAALRIAGEHSMRPAMRGGVPVEGRYTMRVPFTLD